MRRFFMVAVAVWLCAATSNAQTKVSGTAQFSKPDPVHALPVGDRADHNMVVEQLKCTWTKPLEIGGDKAKDGISTETADVRGNTGRAHGFHVSTMESGDKIFVSYQGISTMKEGAPTELKGTWEFAGGTGKLKILKGKGTYKCAPSGDSMTCDIEGEYQLGK